LTVSLRREQQASIPRRFANSYAGHLRWPTPQLGRQSPLPGRTRHAARSDDRALAAQGIERCRQADQVVARLTDQTGLGWAKILSQGGTFTWEGWTAPTLGESESHGWGAQALVDIVESLLGLQVTAPGASAILIAPPATGLSYANGTVHTERGAVHIDWKRPVGGGLTLDLTLPTTSAQPYSCPSASRQVPQPAVRASHVPLGRHGPRQVQRRLRTVFLCSWKTSPLPPQSHLAILDSAARRADDSIPRQAQRDRVASREVLTSRQ